MENKKTKKSIVLLIVVFAVILVGANFLYESLSKESLPEKNRDIEPIKALDFEMTNVNGEIVLFSDLYGKPIVLNVWASWCPPCKQEMPYFEEMYKEYSEDVHFVMLNATDGSRETKVIADEFISDNEYTFPVYYDFVEYEGENIYQMASYTYSIRSLPTTFFINSEGFIEIGYAGAINKEVLMDEISRILD